MKHIHNVPWELGDIVPDFVLGKTTCALFLRWVINIMAATSFPGLPYFLCFSLWSWRAWRPGVNHRANDVRWTQVDSDEEGPNRKYKCTIKLESKFCAGSSFDLASSPGHSQILSCSRLYGCETKSGSGLGARLVSTMWTCGVLTNGESTWTVCYSELGLPPMHPPEVIHMMKSLVNLLSF